MRFALIASLALALAGPSLADNTRLLRQPDLSADHLVFVYSGDLWLAARDGSNSRRLTSHPAEEHDPHFSPDGQSVAFAAAYEGNTDVYVMPVSGGTPERLTWHPGDDVPTGWSADGQFVAFASRRETDHGRSAQLYHVPANGGAPVRQMAARYIRGQWNESGERLAYIDFGPAYNGLYGGSAGWKGYRGGSTPSIRILDVAAQAVIDIPGERVNDIEPFWLDGQVYFVSDRSDKIFRLHRFDPDSGQIERLTTQAPWDIRSAKGFGNQVIFEAGGELHRFDIDSSQTETLAIDIRPDLPQTRPGWRDVADNIQNARLSPNGQRALITARGEVFTVPTEHGSTRNLTVSDGSREYPALWSPEGDQLAWIIESLAGQTLMLADQNGSISQRFELGPDFYQLEAWDADNDRIVYTSNRLGLHVIDLEGGDRELIDRNPRESQFSVSLSPDGRYLAYTRIEPNWFHDLYVHDFDAGRSVKVSDGMADVASPAFSPDGQYLFFAASTNTGPMQFGLDMSSQERPYRAALYALVLRADGDSPLAPRTGDEEAADQAEDSENDSEDKTEEDVVTRIDFDGLFERKVSLPGAKSNYYNLAVGAEGHLYYIEGSQPGASVEPPGSSWGEGNRLLRFDMEAREAKEILSGIRSFDIAASGKHLLIQRADGGLAVAETGESIEPEALDLSGLRMHIDPRAEWAQIFDESWRMQRDFFYAANLHGLDWEAVYQRYRPLLAHVGRREDLNDLLVEVIAELHAGHNRIGGGDVHRESGPGVGLLGANFTLDSDRWQVTRVYTGEAWNPFAEGPLDQPGNSVEPGEYILAINGRELSADDNLFARLHNSAGEQLQLRVGPRADGRDARDIIVEPVSSEGEMRLWGWIEANRRAVDRASEGRIGYIYLPNTAGAGYTFFNRMFHAQIDREGLIVDERSNGGGQAANYIVEVLSRRHLSNWVYRDALMSTTPMGALHGPKLMMIDQDAGSGGDYLPYAFRELGIGPLLGTRTWGGLIGIFRNPPLIDGGIMTVPHFRFVDVDNQWTIENEGVAPDIEVKLDPIATNQGRDSQLEAAIGQVLEMLETYSDDIPREPPPLPDELGG